MRWRKRGARYAIMALHDPEIEALISHRFPAAADHAESRGPRRRDRGCVDPRRAIAARDD